MRNKFFEVHGEIAALL